LGEVLGRDASKKFSVGAQPSELSPDDLGGSSRHDGWQVRVDATARLVWPAYPHDPCTNAPERSVDHAVGALSVPPRLKSQPGRYVRPREQEINFEVEVPPPSAQ